MSTPTAAGRDLEIVQADAGLLDEIVPLFDGYRQFYGEPSDPAAAGAFLRERLARRESVVFLACSDGCGVGFIQLYPSFSSVAMRRLWILNDLFVANPVRRRGIARALLTRAEEFSRDTGAKGLVLETATDNLPAQALYESLGWRRVSDFYVYSYERGHRSER